MITTIYTTKQLELIKLGRKEIKDEIIEVIDNLLTEREKNKPSFLKSLREVLQGDFKMHLRSVTEELNYLKKLIKETKQ